MNYTHLTQDERYQIAILIKAGHKQSEIARVMNRHPCTISRELRRNRGQRGYRPKQAHEFSQARMRACENGRRVCTETWAFAEAKLAELWSPEQISGYLKANGQARRQPRNDLSAHLRRPARRRHPASRPALPEGTAKRYGGRERRGTIPNQVSIEHRPAIVDSRKRFGDWEADLVIGAGHQQALVTLNERKSRYALIAHVSAKTAAAVSTAMISLLTPFAACVHTLTTDNGKEFAQHERIALALGRLLSSPIPTPPGSAALTRT
jgi:IS30 family transposase